MSSQIIYCDSFSPLTFPKTHLHCSLSHTHIHKPHKHTRAHTHTHTQTRAHTHTHKRTPARTHTNTLPLNVHLISVHLTSTHTVSLLQQRIISRTSDSFLSFGYSHPKFLHCSPVCYDELKTNYRQPDKQNTDTPRANPRVVTAKWMR